MWQVSYRGVFGPVVRFFEGEARARQWARQVGKENVAEIRFVPTPADAGHPDNVIL